MYVRQERAEAGPIRDLAIDNRPHCPFVGNMIFLIDEIFVALPRRFIRSICTGYLFLAPFIYDSEFLLI